MSTLKATERCRILIPVDPHYNELLLPDIDTFATTQSDSLCFYSVPDRGLTLSGPTRGQPFMVSRLGSRTAWSDRRHRVFTAQPNTKPVELLGAPYHLNRLRFSSNEQLLAASGSALTHEYQEYERELRIYEAGEPYDYGEYRPDVRPNPGLGPGQVRVWDLASGQTVLLEKHRETVSEVTFSQDGALIAALDKHTLCVWEVSSGRCLLSTPKKSQCSAYGFLITPNNDFVMTGDISGIWRYEIRSTNAERLRTLKEDYGTSIAFDGTGRLCAIAYQSGVIYLYDNLSGAELCAIPINERLYSLALSFAGDRLAAILGNTFVSWQLA